jgi:hypothetical protein
MLFGDLNFFLFFVFLFFRCVREVLSLRERVDERGADLRSGLGLLLVLQIEDGLDHGQLGRRRVQSQRIPTTLRSCIMTLRC